MLTSILLLLASVVITGGAFVWGMCRAARAGDEAMEAVLRDMRERRKAGISEFLSSK